TTTSASGTSSSPTRPATTPGPGRTASRRGSTSSSTPGAEPARRTSPDTTTPARRPEGCRAGVVPCRAERSALLAEVHVPAGDRVELAQHDPVGVVAPVLAGHVGEAGACGRAELDHRAQLGACGHQSLPPLLSLLVRVFA